MFKNACRIVFVAWFILSIINVCIITNVFKFKEIYTSEVVNDLWQIEQNRHIRSHKNYNLTKDMSGYHQWALMVAVNEIVNRYPYVSDPDNYGVDDIWNTPEELFANGGDCEDFAIAKYWILHDSGVDPHNMKLLIVYIKSLKGFHAVLDVKYKDKWYIMDINDNRMFPEGFNKDYQILYSVNDYEVKQYK